MIKESEKEYKTTSNQCIFFFKTHFEYISFSSIETNPESEYELVIPNNDDDILFEITGKIKLVVYKKEYHHNSLIKKCTNERLYSNILFDKYDTNEIKFSVERIRVFSL